jgi:hypothetical protein
MSRGRPRHQASRRRMYAPRQRELRERRLHEAREAFDAHQELPWLADGVAAIEIEVEEGLDFESPTSWAVRLSGRASAA